MIIVVTPPAEEPVTYAESLNFCRLDELSLETGASALFGALITSARQQAEQELRRYLVTQTIDLYLDAFPSVSCDRIESRPAIYLPPTQSVSAITYTDTAGNTQTLATDLYNVDVTSRPARITPAYGQSWPSTRNQANAVKLRFVAGYGAASAVPACVKAWMMMKIAEMHPSVAQPMPEYAGGLLDPERVTGRIT